MKKIISMGIASAVLALTAIAASADIAATGAAEVETGKTVEIAITTTADITDYGLTLAADGLEFVEAKGLKSDFDIAAAQEDGSVILTGASSFKAGETIATFVYTVTAEKDADVNVALTGMPGYEKDAFVNYTAKVVEAGTTEDPTTDPTNPDNPPMGVALAVVPAVIAGAAVVVAKKRK